MIPQTSIIITTNNRPELLVRAIDSARASTDNREIIVVDDASSDETAELCKTFAGITYVRVDRNQGVAGARNIGLVASRGEYVSFLDDDDVRLPNSVAMQVEILDRDPSAGLIYGQAIPVTEENSTTAPPFPENCPQGDVFWRLLSHNFIPCGTVVFRRSCLARVGLLDDGIPRIDDWDLWVRIAELYPVIAVPTPVLLWRQSTPSSNQGSAQTVDLIALGARCFRGKWTNLPRVMNAAPGELDKAWRSFSRNVSEHLAWQVFSALRRAEFRPAAKSALTLLRFHPAGVLEVVRRWLNMTTLTRLSAAALGGGDMEGAKAHFKQIRSSKAN